MGSHGTCIDSYCKGNHSVIRLQVYVGYKMTSFHSKRQFCFARRCVSTFPLSSMMTRPQSTIPLHDVIIFRCLQITPIFLKEIKTVRMYKPKKTEERKKTILASPPSPEQLEPTSDFYKSLLPLLCNSDVKTMAHMITNSSWHADTDKQTHTHTHTHAHVHTHALVSSQ